MASDNDDERLSSNQFWPGTKQSLPSLPPVEELNLEQVLQDYEKETNRVSQSKRRENLFERYGIQSFEDDGDSNWDQLSYKIARAKDIRAKTENIRKSRWNNIMQQYMKIESENVQHITIELESDRASECFRILDIDPVERTDEEVQKILSYVGDLRFIRNLSDAVKLKFCRFARLRNFKPKEYVVREGDYADSFFVILKGTVSVTRYEKGRDGQISLVRLIRGDSFGELAFLDPSSSKKRVGSVISNESTVMLECHECDYNRVLRPVQDEELCQKMIWLKACPLVQRELTLKTIQEIAYVSSLVRYPKHTVVLREKAPARSLFFVAEGEARAVSHVTIPDENGDMVGVAATLRVYGAGEFFGEECVIPHAYRAATVITNTDVTLLVVNRYDFSIRVTRTIIESIEEQLRSIPRKRDVRNFTQQQLEWLRYRGEFANTTRGRKEEIKLESAGFRFTSRRQITSNDVLSNLRVTTKSSYERKVEEDAKLELQHWSHSPAVCDAFANHEAESRSVLSRSGLPEDLVPLTTPQSALAPGKSNPWPGFEQMFSNPQSPYPLTHRGRRPVADVSTVAEFGVEDSEIEVAEKCEDLHSMLNSLNVKMNNLQSNKVEAAVLSSLRGRATAPEARRPGTDGRLRSSSRHPLPEGPSTPATSHKRMSASAPRSLSPRAAHGATPSTPSRVAASGKQNPSTADRRAAAAGRAVSPHRRKGEASQGDIGGTASVGVSGENSGSEKRVSLMFDGSLPEAIAEARRQALEENEGRARKGGGNEEKASEETQVGGGDRIGGAARKRVTRVFGKELPEAIAAARRAALSDGRDDAVDGVADPASSPHAPFEPLPPPPATAPTLREGTQRFIQVVEEAVERLPPANLFKSLPAKLKPVDEGFVPEMTNPRLRATTMGANMFQTGGESPRANDETPDPSGAYNMRNGQPSIPGRRRRARAATVARRKRRATFRALGSPGGLASQHGRVGMNAKMMSFRLACQSMGKHNLRRRGPSIAIQYWTQLNNMRFSRRRDREKEEEERKRREDVHWGSKNALHAPRTLEDGGRWFQRRGTVTSAFLDSLNTNPTDCFDGSRVRSSKDESRTLRRLDALLGTVDPNDDASSDSSARSLSSVMVCPSVDIRSLFTDAQNNYTEILEQSTVLLVEVHFPEGWSSLSALERLHARNAIEQQFFEIANRSQVCSMKLGFSRQQMESSEQVFEDGDVLGKAEDDTRRDYLGRIQVFVFAGAPKWVGPTIVDPMVGFMTNEMATVAIEVMSLIPELKGLAAPVYRFLDGKLKARAAMHCGSAISRVFGLQRPHYHTIYGSVVLQTYHVLRACPISKILVTSPVHLQLVQSHKFSNESEIRSSGDHAQTIKCFFLLGYKFGCQTDSKEEELLPQDLVVREILDKVEGIGEEYRKALSARLPTSPPPPPKRERSLTARSLFEDDDVGSELSGMEVLSRSDASSWGQSASSRLRTTATVVTALSSASAAGKPSALGTEVPDTGHSISVPLPNLSETVKSVRNKPRRKRASDFEQSRLAKAFQGIGLSRSRLDAPPPPLPIPMSARGLRSMGSSMVDLAGDSDGSSPEYALTSRRPPTYLQQRSTQSRHRRDQRTVYTSATLEHGTQRPSHQSAGSLTMPSSPQRDRSLPTPRRATTLGVSLCPGDDVSSAESQSLSTGRTPRMSMVSEPLSPSRSPRISFGSEFQSRDLYRCPTAHSSEDKTSERSVSLSLNLSPIISRSRVLPDDISDKDSVCTAVSNDTDINAPQRGSSHATPARGHRTLRKSRISSCSSNSVGVGFLSGSLSELHSVTANDMVPLTAPPDGPSRRPSMSKPILRRNQSPRSKLVTAVEPPPPAFKSRTAPLSLSGKMVSHPSPVGTKRVPHPTSAGAAKVVAAGTARHWRTSNGRFSDLGIPTFAAPSSISRSSNRRVIVSREAVNSATSAIVL